MGIRALHRRPASRPGRVTATDLNEGMAEKVLDRRIETIRRELAAAAHVKILTYHTRRSTGSERGFFDRVYCGPGGALFRELKRADSEGIHVPDEQVAWVEMFRAAGFDADFWQPHDLTSGRIARELGVIARRRPRAMGGPIGVHALCPCPPLSIEMFGVYGHRTSCRFHVEPPAGGGPGA